MEALSKQKIQSRIGSSLMNQLMMAGEFPFVDLAVSNRRRGAQKNRRADRLGARSTLGSFIPSASPSPRKNSHPAAARLYVDFILSEEGQTSMRQPEPNSSPQTILPNPPRLHARPQAVRHQAGVERDLQQV